MSKKRAKARKQTNNKKKSKLIQEAKKASINARINKENLMKKVSEGTSEVKSRLKSILVMDRALK